MLPALKATLSGKLTKMQEAFVEELLINGGNLEQAAINAGYAKGSAQRQAYALMNIPHVIEAYQIGLAQRLAASASGAVSTITDLSRNSRSDYVKLQASQDILDRIGMRAPDKVDHRVAGQVSVSIDLG